MTGKRLALAALLAALLVVASGGQTNSTGQSPGAPGVTYGGVKDQYSAWLRLDPGRRAIASIQMDWAIRPDRCSNNKTYSSVLYGGYEEVNPISVGPDGKFKRTIVSRYRFEGSRHEEHEEIMGTITGDVATGSISGRVKVVKPNGQVVRCDFGPQRWRMVD